MHEDLEIQPGVTIPADELGFTASRSGGPGGQHVNRTSSKITLHWDVLHSQALDETQRSRVLQRLRNRITEEGVLVLHVEDERSQHRNRALALERLAELLRVALRVARRRRPTRPGPAAKARRLAAKKRRGAIKAFRHPPSTDE